MTRLGTIVGLVILLVIGVAFGYAAWQMYTSTSGHVCAACGRPLHSETKTVAEVDGRRELFCCPTCLLTARLQTGESVTVTALSDYETRSDLEPDAAYVVQGSNLNFCMEEHSLMHQVKQAAWMDFDRCRPSLISFAHKEAAEEFRQKHGGVLLRFKDLAPSFQ